MKRFILCGLIACIPVLPALAGGLDNPGFELEFGPREDLNMWGDYGETFGETYQVDSRKGSHPASHSGDRLLLINLPQNSWNGVWQQLPWGENEDYTFKAYYLIKGGDLPEGSSTFLKVEFFDDEDNHIGAEAGRPRTEDTGGRWLPDTLRGTTPPKTASIRLVLIAGNNPDGPGIENRIYWDDAELTE